MTLEQAVAPRATPPRPLLKLVRGMCARTVTNMMADLQAEVDRRRAAGERAGRAWCLGSGGGRPPPRCAWSLARMHAYVRWERPWREPCTAVQRTAVPPLPPFPCADEEDHGTAGSRGGGGPGGAAARQQSGGLVPPGAPGALAVAPLASFTARAADLFAGAAPLQLTIEL